MIFCYSVTEKTKVYAEVLSEIVGQPVYMLEAEIGQKMGLGFMARALWLTIRGVPSPILNFPAADAFEEEIYVCCPVWGGYVAAPIRTLIESEQIRGKKVNLLLTASASDIKYSRYAEQTLKDAGCVPGAIGVFATQQGYTPEREVAEEHIRSLLYES